MKREYMNDMYIDVANYIMETGKYGYGMESDDEEVMEWLLEMGDDKVEDMLEDMITEYR
jgi:hypothetical protein